MTASTKWFIGERLHQCREAMGITAISLAEFVGVTKQAISRYEHSMDAPGDEIFERICKLFQHEPHFFLKPINSQFSGGVVFYRSMASTTKTARSKAEARHLWIRELINYLGYYIQLPAVDFPILSEIPADPTALHMYQVEQAAEILRTTWGLGKGPIPNLVRTMEHHGAIVLRHPLEAATLDALSSWAEPEGIPYVLLNSDKNCCVRSRLDLAHELGHLLLHRQVGSNLLKKKATFALIEAQAFRFGAAFLLPAQPFIEDVYSITLDTLKALKRKWKVSVAMMIERLKDLEIIDEEQHRKLRMNYVARKWSRNEPFDNEIALEQPSVLSSAFQMLVKEGLQTPEQISANSGYSAHWVKTLMNVPLDQFAPEKVNVKILPFRKIG